MSLLTKQEAFNIMVRGLAAQGWAQSKDPVSGYCKYRGPNGVKCAVGHLISDEEYKPEMEGEDIHGLQRDFHLLQDQDKDFLTHCQMAHDLSTSALNLQTRMVNVSRKYNLTCPIASE